MSENQLKAFIARLANDPDLRSRLNSENSDPVAIAKSVGFSITNATHYHFDNKSKSTVDQRDDESELALSDEDVEEVVGGRPGSCRCHSRHFV